MTTGLLAGPESSYDGRGYLTWTPSPKWRLVVDANKHANRDRETSFFGTETAVKELAGNLLARCNGHDDLTCPFVDISLVAPDGTMYCPSENYGSGKHEDWVTI